MLVSLGGSPAGSYAVSLLDGDAGQALSYDGEGTRQAGWTRFRELGDLFVVSDPRTGPASIGWKMDGAT